MNISVYWYRLAIIVSIFALYNDCIYREIEKMKDYSYVFNAHPSYIDSIYKQYVQDPANVEEGWRIFFDGFEFGEKSSDNGVAAAGSSAFSNKEFAVLSIIHGFRSRGHLVSTTNPIRARRDRKPHLDLADYGLTEADLGSKFQVSDEINMENATLQEMVDKLQKVYCGNIGFEYAHIENREKRMWLRDKIENRALTGGYGLSVEKKQRILKKLNGAVVFEKFLHTKYIGQKRFSLEGGETTIAALDAIVNKGAEEQVEEVVIGMAHRGRLNVLVNTLGKTYESIFNEFEGNSLPDQSFGDGDVKYHLGYSSMVETPSGRTVHLKLAPNPSHLEAVDPVVEGFARAKADLLYGSDYDKILPILIHGDAAVAGQGVVYEVVQMSQLEGYYTGGTIHYVINNQIGFTTNFDDARSSTYCTAAASLVQAPVFHVNGDDPEAVIFAAELATEYRQKFNNDVFIDMVCYRRHGHNEGDDPKFTQPLMYDIISQHPNPRDIYSKKLNESGTISAEITAKIEKDFWNDLQDRLNSVKEKDLPYTYQEPEREWKKLKKTTDASDFEKSPATGISKAKIKNLVDKIMALPEGFVPLSKVNRLQKSKDKLIAEGKMDWALAELLAYASILEEGKDVRMSGQDVRRGTFSHRHAVYYDDKTFEEYNKLSRISDDQGKFRIYNSLLSEYAVLGFEFGYSLASPNSLVIWEAQFGDFYNGAQVMVDQFITASESKWQRMSGLVMLLPHGYEGQGPEHSSARLERFLQSAAEYNITVANMTTPANMFHVLRRQLARPFRKPLIIMSPKSMLRHAKCISPMEDFESKNSFQEIYDDADAKAKDVKKVLMCSGKIYYDLLEKQTTDKRKDVAIVRIEQLYPYPEKQIETIFSKYKGAEFLWVQEESANMGSWDYLMRYWRKKDIELISRKRSASPATGFKKIHEKQQAELIEKAFR